MIFQDPVNQIGQIHLSVKPKAIGYDVAPRKASTDIFQILCQFKNREQVILKISSTLDQTHKLGCLVA
jgi:hypothetical protein